MGYPQNILEKEFWKQEIPTRKTFRPKKTTTYNFEATKYPQEEDLDPPNIHKKNFWTTKYPRDKKLHSQKAL